MGEREEMSTQEATFSYTLKVLTNLFSIRGEDADKMEQHLLEAKTLLPLAIEVTKLAQQLEQTGDPLALVQKVFPNATVIEDTPVAPTGVPQQQTFAPVPPPSAGAPTVTSSAPTCSHGVKSAKKGNGAKGEWRAWMCPAPKGTPDQCSPAWVAKATAEWNNFPA